MKCCPMSGKQVFASAGQAHRAASCMCKRHPNTSKALPYAKARLTAYRCRACGGFHLGHGIYV